MALREGAHGALHRGESRIPVSGFRFQIPDWTSWFPHSDSINDFRMQVSGFRFRIPDWTLFGLRILNFRFPVSGFRFRIRLHLSPESRIPVSGFRFQIPDEVIFEAKKFKTQAVNFAQAHSALSEIEEFEEASINLALTVDAAGIFAVRGSTSNDVDSDASALVGMGDSGGRGNI